jgi:hypothetical protein
MLARLLQSRFADLGSRLAYAKVSRHHLILVIDRVCGAASDAALP